jgi:outer membrane receptor protein involved in Fe transport
VQERKMKVFKVPPIAFLVSTLATNVYADVQVESLEPLTVTAGRGVNLEQMPISSTTLNREEVSESPATSVDQILSKVPSIYVPQVPTSEVHPTGQVFSIRGFGTSTNINTLVMVDGVPLNDSYFRTIDWSRIPKDSIQDIEVIRGGGATSMWGNMAMGGVVNVITRDMAPQEKGLNISYGSYNTLTADASANLFSNDVVSSSFSYGYQGSSGYNLTPSAYRNPNMVATGSDVNNVNWKTFFTPSTDSKYYINLNANLTNENGLVYNNANNTWNNYTLSGGGTTRLNDKDSVSVSAWATNTKYTTQNGGFPSNTYTLNNPSVGTPYITQQENANYTTVGGSAFYSTEVGSLKDIKVGVDARNINLTDNNNMFNALGTNGGNTPAVMMTSQATNTFEGIFASGIYKFSAIPMDLSVGLRQDFWQATNASINGLVQTNGTPINNNLANNSYSGFNPNAGLKYWVNDLLDLRAAAYKNFSAPGMNMSYRAFSSGSTFTAANPSLNTQTNTGTEIGFDVGNKENKFSATAYLNQLNNYIDYATMCTSSATCSGYLQPYNLAGSSFTTVKQYYNAGNAQLKGFELIGKTQLTDTLGGSAGFTRTTAELTSTSNATVDPLNQQLGQVPPWMLNVSANWKALPDLNLVAQVQTFPNYWANTTHTQLNQGASVVGFSANYKWDKMTTVYASAQNLFNRQYYASGLTTGSTTAQPTLAMPLWITVGAKMTF